jgi:uncharacterized protein (TIGR04255 family)
MPVADTALDRHTTSAPTRRHYDRAPIQEVIVTLRATVRDDISPDALLRVRAGVEADYPEAVAMVDWDGGAALRRQVIQPSTHTSQVIGQEFRSGQLHEAFQARVDGFSYHKRAPYTEWEEWSPRAYAAWERYITAVQPSAVTQVSVRYVNRIEIPTQGELKEYLLTAPDIAPGLPQVITGYAMQVTIPRSEPQTFVVIRQATVESTQPRTVPILLDIEVVRTVNIAPNSTDLKAQIEQLHVIEIETFERCITNRTREIIA